MRLPILVINSNLHPISHRFHCRLLVKCALWTGGSLFSTLVQGEPSTLRTTEFGIKKLETSLYRAAQNAFDILNRFDLAHECAGQTDR